MTTRTELGVRSLLVGAVLGALLAAANVYTGLKTAFVDGGAITAVILGFGLLRTRIDPGTFARELNVVQAVASSAAVMVGVAGLAGPWPALFTLGIAASAPVLIGWGLALGVLGIVVADALRKPLIERDRLPFPTGAATAEVIGALVAGAHLEHRRRTIVLGGAALLAAGIAYAQQGMDWIPAVVAVPIAALGPATSLAVATSPLVMATGVMVGMRIAVAMAISGGIIWIAIVPAIVARGWIASVELGDAIRWTMWPAVGLLLGEAVHALVSHRATISRSFADIRRSASASGRGRVLGAAAVAVVVVLVIGRV